MQNVIAIFVGIILFLVVIAIQKFAKADILDRRHKKNRLLNIGWILTSFLVSVFLYYAMCRLAGIHCKLCCTYKAWMIMLALFAVYRQLFCLERYWG